MTRHFLAPYTLLLIAVLPAAAQKTAPPAATPALIETGNSLFQQNCAFCHGRDAGGGETGPDLTESKVVKEDVNGDKIGVIVRNGIVEKGMPKFALPDQDIAALVAFVHDQKRKADSQQGGRRGVDVSDLQTGNVEAGRAYFNGAGGCASCHSPTGDLAGVGKRHVGLELEQRMLNPGKIPGTVVVTLPSGETVKGTFAAQDEFTIALRDSSGHYHSWPTDRVKFTVKTPVDAHIDLLAKYTDTDIHNLIAYLQTLN
jgi:cytochrome c oxidase cbb3-type subunit 3